MGFPVNRLRRLREQSIMRDLVCETNLGLNDLIYPMFVTHGTNIKNEIPSMPGQYQWSVDQLTIEIGRIVELGIKAVILFGIPEKKDECGSDAYHEDGIVQQAIRAIKAEKLDLMVIGDVCLCEYTSHGHCGMLDGEKIDNDKTLPLLAATALAQARAGVDMVAPSDMMDGRVDLIRQTLDAEGFTSLPIMSYSAKYASAFYGPFREAVGSAPSFGDRRSHQMNPANSDEAIREVELDLEEGADIIMVKPALAYLDVIYKIKQEFPVPLAAYAVSGEYAMIEAAAANGWVDRDRMIYESLVSIKRAGADIILTYHAVRVAELIRDQHWPVE